MCAGVDGPSVNNSDINNYRYPVRNKCDKPKSYGVKRTCNKCGQIYPNNSRCPKCGHKIYTYPRLRDGR